jgi:hypothetical protein
MNDQIKALMGQTLDEKFAGTWSTMDMQDLTKFAERFAELIVKECLDIVNRKEYSYHEADPLWETAQLIKQHFGVEE